MDGAVDTLVYQLEDEDAGVRLATLQRLRQLAGMERARLAVRNPRRFLQCVRRRLADDDACVALEALRLVGDVMRVLGDDVEQVLASILPHLIAKLARDNTGDSSSTRKETAPSRTEEGDDAVHEVTFQVFRKYVHVTSDLRGVAHALVNLGLAHGRGNVREATLSTLMRLIDERYGGRTAATRRGSSRVDTTLFTELTQAIVPMLEDTEESVVVVAEEAVAQLQRYWGEGFQDVMQFLSREDKATLLDHHEHIDEFVRAASASVSSSVSASQVLCLRASIASMPPVASEVRFGFVSADVVEALKANTGNSNIEWKKRTAAVEQMYAAAKGVDPPTLLASIVELRELFAILTRLLQDIDVHLVKRALQIMRLVVVKMHQGEIEEVEFDRLVVQELVGGIFPSLVETSANFAEDEAIGSQVSVLFQTIFKANLSTASSMTVALLSSMEHRRLQIREEGLRVWVILLITAHSNDFSITGVVNQKTIHVLCRALADGSSRVRQMAMEAAAVLGIVTGKDMCTIIENQADDFILERIDVDALFQRTRIHRLPKLDCDGRLRDVCGTSTVSGYEQLDKSKATATRSPTCAATQSMTARSEPSLDCIGSAEVLVGVSELQIAVTSGDLIYAGTTTVRRSKAEEADKRLEDTRRRGNMERTQKSRALPHNDPSDTMDDMKNANKRTLPASQTDDDTVELRTDNRREVTSAPGEPVADKLLALKRKAEQLRKSASSRQVVVSDKAGSVQLNPQDGDLTSTKERPRRSMEAETAFEDKRTEATRSVHCDDHTVPFIAKRGIRPPQEYRDDREDRRMTQPINAKRGIPAPQHYSEEGEDDSTASPRTSVNILRARPQNVTTAKNELRQDAQPDLLEDRPIRPLNTNRQSTYEEYSAIEPQGESVEKKKSPAVMSLATRKRLQAKQRADLQEGEVGWDEGNTSNSPPRQALQQLKKRDDSRGAEDDLQKGPSRKGSMAAGPPPGLGKQEPRYLEQHELKPLKDPKQDASKMLNHLRSDDWEANFDALTTVRRLVAHHPKLVEDKIHAVVTEVLRHVPNLRSSVAKNALLALDSMCGAFGKMLDGELESVVSILIKRSTDANTFVCESATASINAVILNCSTLRVVNAIASHLSSRAIAIRREVARAMHTVIVSLADQVQTCKELGLILSIVGKCLEDSNNEVRDAAKQSIVYLHLEQGVDTERLKKMLPSSLHSKLDQLLVRKGAYGIPTIRPPKPDQAKSSSGPREDGDAKKPTRKGSVLGSTKDAPGMTATRRTPTLDAEALATLIKKLDSNNWKERFDALTETSAFVGTYGTALCESGKLVNLFDSIIKRMEDGNAKVSTLTLELLDPIISVLGNGMEQVLQSFVPAVAKGLAASNAKQAGLAHAAIQTLCSSIDARLLCQHFAAVARHANSRIKPTLIEVLDQLSESRDDKNQFALTRYVLPLALELLKEAKSDVKDVNARLLRTLHKTLGQSMLHSVAKLSAAQQERLSAILGVPNLT